MIPISTKAIETKHKIKTIDTKRVNNTSALENNIIGVGI